MKRENVYMGTLVKTWMHDKNTKYVTFSVTDDCNLMCEYCYGCDSDCDATCTLECASVCVSQAEGHDGSSGNCARECAGACSDMCRGDCVSLASLYANK